MAGRNCENWRRKLRENFKVTIFQLDGFFKRNLLEISFLYTIIFYPTELQLGTSIYLSSKFYVYRVCESVQG